MATQSQIAKWFDEGVINGEAYMVVVCDTFDYCDYPVYSSSRDGAQAMWDNPGDMQRARHTSQ